ncbi:LAMI_0E10924g1_1 [Lachancea mirantina]|uniref:LAMI_0E10924g1_1 n=1 Tax=Lachancea mirantina TaxID=1230905 RepID=A0A1G4JP72_9SACH|nr:LAMI_0E10924g1_1 [Lachancea mirantina]
MVFKQEYLHLNNGNKIPAVAVVGTGTRWYKSEETSATFSKPLVEQIKYALTLPGIIHIDAAEIYRTYSEVGEALKEAGRAREEIFITDKYSTFYFKLTDSPRQCLDISCQKMGVDYVDLFLLHSPFIDEKKYGFTLEEAWTQMEELYKAGKAKNIGVSNFSKEDLSRILKSGTIKPQVNQIEFSPFLQNQTPGIYDFCQKHDILLEAYSPLGPLQREPENSSSDPFYQYVKKLADKYQKSEASIILRWVSKRGVLPVTTSSKPQRVRDAQLLYDFDLQNSEVEEITKRGLAHAPLRLYWAEQMGKFDAEAQKL